MFQGVSNHQSLAAFTTLYKNDPLGAEKKGEQDHRSGKSVTRSGVQNWHSWLVDDGWSTALVGLLEAMPILTDADLSATCHLCAQQFNVPAAGFSAWFF